MRAARIFGGLFGVMAGLGGIRHGIGEIRQGSTSPEGMIFDSWSEGPISRNMDGEPAFSLVPDLLATGILTLAVSAALLVWSIGFIQRPRGAHVLILLSIALFLFGGGFGPPLVGVLAGVGMIAIEAPHPWVRRSIPGSVIQPLAALWPWLYAVSATTGAFVFIGSLILVYISDANYATVVLNSFYLMILSMILTIAAGVAHQSTRGEPAPLSPGSAVIQQ